MTNEQAQNIAKYVKQINRTIADEDLLIYVVNEVVDRVLIYLNTDELDSRLERVIARIASGIFAQTSNNLEATSPDVSIKSISDNGQSITYSEAVKNYLATAEDGELFSGFAKLLAPYRRVNVIS